ncbi:MAG TPA: PLDc N-terminal domain-containing protein [Acidimicrobiia bacterium]|nr:PLDc N-terminal domain-containing protein [Acidimicrobiia bacterium]
MPVAALAPLVILAIGFVAWVIRDILRSEVRYLPRWGWIVVTLLSIPLGGIVYLLMGREPE